MWKLSEGLYIWDVEKEGMSFEKLVENIICVVFLLSNVYKMWKI